MDLAISEMNIRLKTVEEHMALDHCLFSASDLRMSTENYWLLDQLSDLFAPYVQQRISAIICPSIEESLLEMNNSLEQHLLLSDIVPQNLLNLLAISNASLHYRIRSLSFLEREMVMQLQVEWQNETLDRLTDHHLEALMEVNDGGEEVRFWLEERAVNDLLAQIQWHRLVLEQNVPVSSPVIPESQRNFLNTLCTTCFFIVNLTAVNPPVITVTNGSLVLHTEDSIFLRVVNPEKNVTSVFMSFVLKIEAALRPSMDNGTIRTLIQLLDTNIKFNKGVFPPNWSLFVEDLMKGMILDMLWPEMRSSIEQFSYTEGIHLADSCGFDGRHSAFLIDEGRIGIRTRLALDRLDSRRCVADMRSAIPSPQALIQAVAPKF